MFLCSEVFFFFDSLADCTFNFTNDSESMLRSIIYGVGGVRKRLNLLTQKTRLFANEKQINERESIRINQSCHHVQIYRSFVNSGLLNQ